MRPLVILLPCSLVLAGCNPIGWWQTRPLHPNARVEAFTPEGRPEYTREWRQRKRHGTWRRFWEDGTVKDESSYALGRKQGPWKTFYPNGKPQSDGAYQDDREHGVWVSWHENGQKSFEGTFVHGKRHGKFYSWNEQGRLIEETDWKEGVKLTPEGMTPDGSL